MRGYEIPFVNKPFQLSPPTERVYSDEDKYNLSHAIKDLLDKGAVSKCLPSKNQFLSSYFLVDKPNGGKRFILNLKKLNKFVKTSHFKMEDMKNVIRLIYPHCYMATIDLKDSYFLISVNEKYRKYLRFKFNGQLYQFNCLAFGLSTAPQVFTKLLRPVAHYLRSRGLNSIIYLDDIFMWSNTVEECKINIHNTRKLLESLGFVLNLDKCQLTPQKKIKFLGFLVDSEKFLIQLPDNKKQIINNLLSKFSKLKSCRIRDLAKLIGTLISACPAVEYSRLYTKALEREKVNALRQSKSDFSRKMNLSKHILPDLQWWSSQIGTATRYIRNNKYTLEIFSDASLTGWGAVCSGKKAHGFWSQEEKKLHINYLELKAAHMGLKCFAKDLKNCQILLRIDNTTAIALINRYGSVQREGLNNLSRQIWQWCEQQQLWIFATYIISRENFLADAESRRTPEEIEYEIADWAFQKIDNLFGTFDVDLFASHKNYKCKKFVSWKRDPEAWKIDAFTISWTNLYFYALPPFTLIGKVLSKIREDQAEGILVVPYWPSQCWFSVFKELSIGEPIFFSPDANLLISCSREPHPLHKSLTLAATKLSGKHTSVKEHQRHQYHP